MLNEEYCLGGRLGFYPDSFEQTPDNLFLERVENIFCSNVEGT